MLRKTLITVAAIAATTAAASVAGVVIGNTLQGDPPSPANSHNVQTLPNQVPIGGPNGQIVGYANRDDLFATPPAHAAGTPAENRPVEVHTKGGGHVGWAIPGIGFMTQDEFVAWRKAGSPSNTVSHGQAPDGSETVTVGP